MQNVIYLAMLHALYICSSIYYFLFQTYSFLHTIVLNSSKILGSFLTYRASFSSNLPFLFFSYLDYERDDTFAASSVNIRYLE